MKELIPKNELGIFADMQDTARADSLFVAKFFEKKHKNVLRDIQKILESDGLSEEFKRQNFVKSSYLNQQNKRQPCYCMTRDGFTMLVMGYTGKKAMKFKELYLTRFNEMEQFIGTLVSTRQEFPHLTDTIKSLHKNPKPYHYSNECDMLNRIVLGMSAKQFRLVKGIKKGESIRPYLTEEQVEMLETLQAVDVGLLVAIPDYQQRKQRLESYAEQRWGKLV